MKSTATACGKVILFGEHSVVYGYPAIAVPVKNLSLTVEATAHSLLAVESPDFEDVDLLQKGVVKILEKLETENHNIRLNITTTLPLASGLGSSAAFAVAATKAIAEFYNIPLTERQVIETSYEAEKVFHGTPSGIDNTVVGYSAPVWFVKDKESDIIKINSPLNMLIVDTGIKSKTSEVVAEVRERYEKNKDEYKAIFYDIESTATKARVALEDGYIKVLGKLMNENQTALERIGVSTPEIDDIIATAKNAGAIGAKISGAGRGGNVIILCEKKDNEKIKQALESKAKNIVETVID